jgi:hypothetical protein
MRPSNTLPALHVVYPGGGGGGGATGAKPGVWGAGVGGCVGAQPK